MSASVDVASFYRFVDIEDPPGLCDRLQAECDAGDLLGTILVAGEGINASLAGKRQGLARLIAWIEAELGFDAPLDVRWTRASAAPFRRMRVRHKKEIVTLGRPDVRPQAGTGRHVSPDEWNRLIGDSRTLIIDTRNRYEIEVGSFPGARDPGTDSFRGFPAFVESLSAEDRERPVAMFCTGGIRCEKAAALMQTAGFRNVHQLAGGILNYLDRVADDDNRWQGECFVFDTRVAVDRDLAEGGYVQCHACRRPLSQQDLESPAYREGVSCPRCIDDADSERNAGLEERRRQVRLARQRGEVHIGPKSRRSD